MSAFRQDPLGQLLVIGLEEDHWNSSVEGLIRASRPGGILFTAHNLRSPDSTAELLAQISRTLSIPAFLGIEEEGGAVDPLCAFFPPLPSPRATAERGLAAVARLGELVARASRLLGFNTIFAPVLDVSPPGSETFLGTRTFSSRPREVARCGKAFVRGLTRNNVLACGKHFPGLGSARIDDPSQPPVIGKPMAALWSEDLVPYRELLRQFSLVMVSRGSYKAYDFDFPRSAQVSVNVVEGLLRVKLGYPGVAIADGLETEARRQMLDLGELAVRSMNAGCDLLLVRSEKAVEVVLAGLKDGVESGELSSRRVRQALERIRIVKKGLLRPRGRISKTHLDQLTRQFENFGKVFGPRERKIA